LRKARKIRGSNTSFEWSDAGQISFSGIARPEDVPLRRLASARSKAPPVELPLEPALARPIAKIYPRHSQNLSHRLFPESPVPPLLREAPNLRLGPRRTGNHPRTRTRQSTRGFSRSTGDARETAAR